MGEIKRRQVNFRLNADEAERLESKAADMGMSLSAFCKSAALNKKLIRPMATKAQMRKILEYLGKNGGLLNQIARKLNQGGTPELDDFRALRAESNALWDMILDNIEPVEQLEAARARRDAREKTV